MRQEGKGADNAGYFTFFCKYCVAQTHVKTLNIGRVKPEEIERLTIGNDGMTLLEGGKGVENFYRDRTWGELLKVIDCMGIGRDEGSLPIGRE